MHANESENKKGHSKDNIVKCSGEMVQETGSDKVFLGIATFILCCFMHSIHSNVVQTPLVQNTV